MVHGALYRAYFIDDINVCDLKEMLMTVTALNLDIEGVRHVLKSYRISDAVEGGWPYPRRIV